MQRHLNRDARRLPKVVALLLGGLLLLGVIAVRAAMDWIADTEVAAGVREDDGDPRPRLDRAHASLVERLASPPRPVAASHALELDAEEPPTTNKTPVHAPLAGDLEELLAHRKDDALVAYLETLAAATDDSGSVPSPETRAWLAAHDAAIVRVQDAAIPWADEELRRAFEDDRLTLPRLWIGRFPMNLAAAHVVRPMIAARAAIAATDGAQAEADRGCEALLRLQAMQAMVVNGRGVPWMACDLPTLRRVRPSNAPDWIAFMDGAAARDALVSATTNGVLYSPPKGPYRISRSGSFIETLHEDLPRPLRRGLDGAVLAPVARTRWALETHELLDAGAALERGDDCLPPMGAGESTAEHVWLSTLRDVAVRQADMLLTREVLRLSGGSSAEPTVSPCPEWWLSSDELPDGHRVHAEGSIRALAAKRKSWPPLEYAFH